MDDLLHQAEADRLQALARAERAERNLGVLRLQRELAARRENGLRREIRQLKRKLREKEKGGCSHAREELT